MKVLKRDKTVEEFKISKIEKAICAAFESCGMKPKSDVLDCVRSTYDESEDSVIDVEDIQDNVERCLMASYPDVAKAYIIYRYQHKLIRETKVSLLNKLKRSLLPRMSKTKMQMLTSFHSEEEWERQVGLSQNNMLWITACQENQGTIT